VDFGLSSTLTGALARAMPSRRTFLTAGAALGTLAVLRPAALSATATTLAPTSMNHALAHHVFFWLKRPGSAEDRAQLIAGLRTLAAIPTVRHLHVGVPASTEKREVVDNSYDVAELMFFDDVAAQEAYQVHPLHKKFVTEHAHLWAKVVVYDSVAP